MSKGQKQMSNVINLDEFLIKELTFTFNGKEYKVKRLTFADYKQANEMFKNLGENPSFEDIEKLVIFMVPDLTSEDINLMDMNQLNTLLEFISQQIIK